MSSLPNIQGADRHKPLCFDPQRNLFITYDDILSGKEKIIHLNILNYDQLKKLIIKRNQIGPDYQIASFNGQVYSRDDVIKAIEEESDFGKMSLNAEKLMLSDLLTEIEQEFQKRNDNSESK